MSEAKDKDLHDSTMQKPMEFTDLVARIIKDSVLFAIVACTTFLLLALVGYDTKDPGWSHLGYQPEVSNWTGKFGALVADICLSFLGLAAWFLPFLIIIPSIRLYLRKQVSLVDSLPFVMVRVVGTIIFVLTFSALLSLHISNASLNLPFTVGGIIGQAFSDWMVSWFSLVGSSVLLWFFALIGLTFILESSWRDILLAVGGGVLYCFAKITSVFQSKADTDYLDDDEESEEDITEPFAEKDPSKSSLFHQYVRRSKTTANTDQEDDALHATTPEQPEKNRPTQDINLGLSAINEVQGPTGNAEKPNGLFNKLSSKIPRVTKEKELGDANMMAEQPLASNTKDELQPIQEVAVSPPSGQIAEQAIKETDEKIEQRITASKASVPETPLEPVANVANNDNQNVDINKKALKIVPLSQTHQSTLNQEEFNNLTPGTVESAPAEIPSTDILDEAEPQTDLGYTAEQLEDMSRLLEVKLKDFGVVVEVVEVNPGPVITRFEIQPAPGVKSSKVVNLAKDLARSLAVLSVRVVEVIPGKSVMGIEIPNINRKMVRLSEVLTASVYTDAKSKLTLALGNDIAGNPVVANLAKMPHLLVAGTTGSGKSVGVNAMILSLLFKASPKDVRLMLVDPKMLELSIYEGIPHLLTPVITDMKEAAGGLRWCVAEMERRYKLMSKMGVRNLDGFNDKVRKAINAGEPLLDPLWDPQENGETPGTPAPQLETLPFIVVVIDEFADMMMIVGKKVEELIARIAQKARAAGIHLILATQRPSVDVITGLIKANVPTRIAFQVSSKIDSRTILDQGGSENLLGNGDMLFLPAGTSVPSRVHGAFVSDDEVHCTVEAWKEQGKPEFIDMQVAEEGASGGSGNLFEDDEQDVIYDEAVAFVTSTRKVSISSVQRKFKIGYNRAARIVESMEGAGVISSAATNGQREVLAPPPPPRD